MKTLNEAKIYGILGHYDLDVPYYKVGTLTTLESVYKMCHHGLKGIVTEQELFVYSAYDGPMHEWAINQMTAQKVLDRNQVVWGVYINKVKVRDQDHWIFRNAYTTQHGVIPLKTHPLLRKIIPNFSATNVIG